MVTDGLIVFAYPPQCRPHNRRRYILAILIADTFELKVFGIEDVELIGILLGEPFNAFVQGAGRAFCLQKGDADILIQQFKSAVEELWRGDGFGP